MKEWKEWIFPEYLAWKGRGMGGMGGGVFCKYRKTESVPLSSTEIKLERRKHIVSVQFSAVSLLAWHSFNKTFCSLCIDSVKILSFWLVFTSPPSEFRRLRLRLPCQHTTSGQPASLFLLFLLFCPWRLWRPEASRQLPPVRPSGPLWCPSVVSKYLTPNITHTHLISPQNCKTESFSPKL